MKKNFEKLKTISAILGVILIFIQIYSWWTQPKTVITAKIDIVDYPLPAQMKEQFSYINIWKKIDTLDKLLKHFDTNFTGPKSILGNFITKNLNLDYLSDFLNKYQTLGILQISNSGDKEIQGIQISSRTKFFYEFSNNNGTIYTGTSYGKIEIGNMRPTEEIIIRLWATAFYEDDILITFPDGAIKPEKIIKVSGFDSLILKFFPSIWSLPLILFF